MAEGVPFAGFIGGRGSSARWPESWPGGDAGGLLGGGGDVLLGRWSTACWLLREQHKVGRRRGVAKGAGGSQREQKAQANRPHPSAMAHLHPGHGYQARLPPSRGRKGLGRLPPAQKLSPSDLVRGLVASIGDGVAGGSHGPRVHPIFFPPAPLRAGLSSPSTCGPASCRRLHEPV